MRIFSGLEKSSSGIPMESPATCNHEDNMHAASKLVVCIVTCMNRTDSYAIEGPPPDTSAGGSLR
jgi:hypothetical protein